MLDYFKFGCHPVAQLVGCMPLSSIQQPKFHFNLLPFLARHTPALSSFPLYLQLCLSNKGINKKLLAYIQRFTHL